MAFQLRELKNTAAALERFTLADKARQAIASLREIGFEHGKLLVRVFCFIVITYVTSFVAFHTKVTVNIGPKEVVRMVTSILLIRCLCYKPERIIIFFSLPPTKPKSKLLRSRFPLFFSLPHISSETCQKLVKTCLFLVKDFYWEHFEQKNWS